MKRWWLIVVFVIGAPLLLLNSLFSSQGEVLGQATKFISPEAMTPGARVFAAMPDPSGQISYNVISADARSLILHEYLQTLDSPLQGHVSDILTAADTYNLDFRLIVAIARQESNLCKYIPEGGHNCWGWGIHQRGTLGFDDYTQAIWTVSKGLREDYLDDGLTTPEQIMARYTPSSPGTWAAAVSQFMGEME